MSEAAMASFSSSKGKQAVTCISASSSDDEDDESEEEEVSECGSEQEPESEEDSDEEDPVSEDGSGSSNDDANYDDYDDNDDEDDDELKGKPSDEELCNKVIDLLRGRKSLNSLKLEECRAYLRKHELRISGTKATCITRILEHWRIKDGNGKKLYPESSFVINCTGDVCKGDVVLFRQRVYEKFDIVKRGGGAKIVGKRIVAGRVVNESYGDGKQQHTFSIDVLWSKGVKALPPLFPLLVKGRNLYRMKTFRQRWSNEAERSRVLAEKHSRGAAARHIREIAKARLANKGSKRKKTSTTTKGPPNKKRKKNLELAATKRKKQNCAQKSSEGHAKKRKVAKTSNLGSSTTRDNAKIRKNSKSRNSGSSSIQSTAEIREVAKTRNSGSSSAHGNAKMREVTKTGNSGSAAAYQEQPSYHSNGVHSEYPYPQRYHHNNYNHTPSEVFHRNYMGIPQTNRGTHHIPSYYVGFASSPARVPHGHMLHSYNVGYASSVHDQISNRAGSVSHPYGNPPSQLDPRRQVAFDDRVPGGRIHGWKRP